MTETMRAFVVTGPGEAGVYQVEVPVAGPGPWRHWPRGEPEPKPS